MPSVLQDLLRSKKFVFVLLATTLLMLAAKFDLLPKEDVTTFLRILWPTYLGAQGLADLGKSAARAKEHAEENGRLRHEAKQEKNAARIIMKAKEAKEDEEAEKTIKNTET